MYCTKLVVCGRLVSYTHTDLACSSLTREPDWGHSCIPCLNTCDPAQLCRGGGLENVIVWLLQKHSQTRYGVISRLCKGFICSEGEIYP